MATSFPAGSDNFTIPNSPGSTALSSSGTGSRNHVQHHRDLGDTIEAMEAEATLAVHSHDGTTARHGNKLLQANTHQSPDTDVGPTSIHHTLGHGANQAAPGNHASLPAFQDTHANSVSWPVGCIYLSTSASNPSGSLGGTWVQVQDAFLVGAGGSYAYTGSVVNNTSTHSHTVADTTSDGSHTHVVSSTDAQGNHGHSAGTSGGSNPDHSHGSVGTGYVTTTSSLDVTGVQQAGANIDGSHLHSHSLGNFPSYSENFHTHALSDYAANGNHAHTVGGVSGSTHSHTVATNSPSHLPTWKAFYVWRRTA